MDNKDSFEEILKTKMDHLEEIPSIKLGNQLKDRLRENQEGNFPFKKIILWAIAGLLLFFVTTQFLQNKNSAIPEEPLEKIQQANRLDDQNPANEIDLHNHSHNYDHNHHSIPDSNYTKAKVLVAQTPDDIKNKPYIQARLQAQAENKMIFLHAFNLDCSHCQKMKDITLADKTVQAFLQEHFVKIDIDLQLLENVGVARYYDIKTSPKFLFLNDKGQLVVIANGFHEPTKFIAILEKAMEEDAAGSYIDLMSKKRVNPTPDKRLKAHPLKNILLPDSILLAVEASKKSILINVFETDCAKCERLKQITYQDKNVQKIIKNHFFRWIIDTEQAENLGLFQNQNIEVSPTTFIYSHSGTWISKFTGFMPPKPFIKILNESVSKHSLQHKGIQRLKANVFPNPTSGIFNVAVEGQKSPLRLKIIDLNGKIILEKTQNEFNQIADFRFDLTGKKGQYIVQLTQGKSMIYKKVIIQ